MLIGKVLCSLFCTAHGPKLVNADPGDGLGIAWTFFPNKFPDLVGQLVRMARLKGTLDPYGKCHAFHCFSSPKTPQKMLIQASIWHQFYSWSEWLPTVSSDRLEEESWHAVSLSQNRAIED